MVRSEDRIVYFDIEKKMQKMQLIFISINFLRSIFSVLSLLLFLILDDDELRRFYQEPIETCFNN